MLMVSEGLIIASVSHYGTSTDGGDRQSLQLCHRERLGVYISLFWLSLRFLCFPRLFIGLHQSGLLVRLKKHIV